MEWILYTAATSPLASSGFAAFGCFRASLYDGIYIFKDYMKFIAKESANLECKIKFFLFSGKPRSQIQFFPVIPSPDQDRTNWKRTIQIGPSVPKEIGFKHCYKDLSAIYKGCIYNKCIHFSTHLGVSFRGSWICSRAQTQVRNHFSHLLHKEEKKYAIGPLHLCRSGKKLSSK